MHLRERAQAVKRGVWEAGGYPVEMPVATLSETFQKPTPMLYRNLLAMDTEEILRSYPFDGAVLMGGCDKSTPALLMARRARTGRSSTCRPAPCSRVTGTEKHWAVAPTCGGSGTKSAPGP